MGQGTFHGKKLRLVELKENEPFFITCVKDKMYLLRREL